MDGIKILSWNFNYIIALRTQNDEWCYDLDTLQNEDVTFYRNLYDEELSPLLDLPASFFFYSGSKRHRFFG